MQNSLKWEKIELSKSESFFFCVRLHWAYSYPTHFSFLALLFEYSFFFEQREKNAKNKVRGAIMISRDGKMEIQEMIENLMANQMKLSDEIKEQLLNPDLDLADYFD